MLASAYRLRAPRAPLHLKMSYMPFARMDRPMGNELFTLQALAKVLNDFQFDTVQTLDAHSNVTSSLIHRCVDVTPLEAITNAMCMFANNSSDMVFTMLPDEGAAKRYRATIMRAMEWANGHVQGELRATILEGRKHRNPITGALESFSLAAGAKDLLTAIEKGISPSVLIVDDICSYGGTFVKAAQAVRSMKALKERLKELPEMGVPMNSKKLTTICRGRRLKKFYMKTLPSGLGKSRMSLADAALISIPVIYDLEQHEWVRTNCQEPTLFITTELEADEVQTMIMAYVSGVDEEHILDGKYVGDEEARVNRACEIVSDAPFYIDHARGSGLLLRGRNPVHPLCRAGQGNRQAHRPRQGVDGVA